MRILFFAVSVSPRLKYIAEHILNSMLGFEVFFTQNADELSTFSGPKICYSHSKTSDCINITPNGLLSLKGIFKQSFAISRWKELPIFFQTNTDGEIPFDIFSASFYLITRYEEYSPLELDNYGRYRVEESLAFQNGFLNIPLVDLWVKELGALIQAKYPEVELRKSSFSFIPTIDVDNAYAYKHKGFVRSMLGMANSLFSLKFKDFTRRIGVLLNLAADPYDKYNELIEVFTRTPQAKWFILGGQWRKFDRNISLKKPAMRELLNRISNNFEVGIHPSYGSGSNIDRIKVEKELLEKAIEKKISISRQHYLRISLPQTYRTLSELGITHDYSMGCSNAVGFRASTCTPYKFYDLLDEKELPLTIVPFQAMDRALLNEYSKEPVLAVQETLKIAKRVKEVGGVFIILWHNESLSGINEWKGWENVLGDIVQGIGGL